MKKRDEVETLKIFEIDINHSSFLTANRSLLNNSITYLLYIFRGSLFKHFNYDIFNNSDVVNNYNVYRMFTGGSFHCSSACACFLDILILHTQIYHSEFAKIYTKDILCQENNNTSKTVCHSRINRDISLKYPYIHDMFIIIWNNVQCKN